METKLQQEINNVLKVFPEYWHEDILLKNKLIEDIRSYNEKLIEALLSNESIRDTYSLELPSGLVFKIEEFISMLRFKNYWDNSYTKYTNEIGLTSENKYFKYNSDVVLDFPHKDGVLEGGMTTEEKGKDEVYYHNTLAKEEIDTLLAPKILTNIIKYAKNEETNLDKFSDKDNLILKANNLIGLYSLRERYAGKVKLIYIDPPYNTGGDSFKYNDQFNHSTWLVFMKNRLEAAKELLSPDGSIWINIDDNESHYAKILMDEIYGRNNFVANIVWQKRTSPDSRISLGAAHDNILVYAKDINLFKPTINKVPLSEKRISEYKNPDNDINGPWVSVDMTGQTGHATKSQFYNVTLPNGTIISSPSNRCWAISEKEFVNLRKQGRIWFGINGDSFPRLKKYLSESDGATSWTWWTNGDVGHNQEAKKK
ncbi:site-specific DNA-methyltransferase [Jeotgalicoccus sp. ATCC 8456]|uniref:site-specific DNA-methyltransferase n=1 Tax=Jeotgalicoccus sp. ATCC 8456 TaxID=946435 RepID=UPI0018E6306F|nr:site-specific DNA-methyltransferase [Jeotgalicoccus sp. ATCC 8456]QQD84524.1 site-specific DNA-methyltransferase [Jeotgalicoccus sp. ATCC 8456]